MKFIKDVKDVCGVDLSEHQINQLEKYYQKLIDYNQKVNLTSITEKEEVYYKHFLDSIALMRNIEEGKELSICDLGSGAGFPSIPLKIVNPNLKVTIVDSLNKRITFLQELVTKLDLDGIELYHDRAELFALKNKESFDLVTARAFGSLSMILEMGTPLLKTGGKLIIMKSKDGLEELKNITNSKRILHVKLINSDGYNLPNNYGYRLQLIFEKLKHNNKYPRTFANIKKNPLNWGVYE